jgi:hypothetical protein
MNHPFNSPGKRLINTGARLQGLISAALVLLVIQMGGLKAQVIFSSSGLVGTGASGSATPSSGGATTVLTGGGGTGFGVSNEGVFGYYNTITNAGSGAGDWSVVAELAKLHGTASATNPPAAGLFMREANSIPGGLPREVSVAVEGSNLVVRRRSTYPTSVATKVVTSSIALPVWLKLSRIGRTFRVYDSADGATWKDADLTISDTTAELITGTEEQELIPVTADPAALTSVKAGLFIAGPNATTTATFNNISATTGPVDESGAGLSLNYYSDPAFATSLATSTSPTVDIAGYFLPPKLLAGVTPVNPKPTGLPSTGIFSARWQGYITAPVSGNYTLNLKTRDAARVWLGPAGTAGSATQWATIIDDWIFRPATVSTAAPVQLTAGSQYPIVIEYTSNSPLTLAACLLLWSCTNSGGSTLIDQSVVPPGALSAGSFVSGLSVPTNFRVNTLTASAIGISWYPSFGEKGVAAYTIYEDDQETAVLTGTLGAGSGFIATNLSPDTSVTLNLSATDASGATQSVGPVTGQTLNDNASLGPWVETDIGYDGVVGSAAILNGTFSIVGAGVGFSELTSDGGHFVYQPQTWTSTTGGSITARITSVGYPNDPAGVSGIMLRSGSGGAFERAPFAALVESPRQGLEFVCRASESTSSTIMYINPYKVVLPYWLRLTGVISGTRLAITPYYSADGTNWTAFPPNTGSASLKKLLTLPYNAAAHNPTIFAGLVATGEGSGNAIAGSFDNISGALAVTLPGIAITSPLPGASSQPGQHIPLAVSITGGDESTYVVTWQCALLSPAQAIQYTPLTLDAQQGWTPSTAGQYLIEATATNSPGQPAESVQSAPILVNISTTAGQAATLQAPTIVPPGGQFAQAVNVVIAASTQGNVQSEYGFSANGPWTQYTAGQSFAVTSSCTVYAKNVSGANQSATTQATFTVTNTGGSGITVGNPPASSQGATATPSGQITIVQPVNGSTLQ